MSYPYENNMTQEMLDNLINPADMVEEYENCRVKYLRAVRAYETRLPATAKSGEPVVHGTRLVMANIAEYWRVRMDAAAPWLPQGYES